MDSKLTEIVRDAPHLTHSIDTKLLLDCTKQVLFSHLFMRFVRHFHILGTSEWTELKVLDELGLEAGFYVGGHDSWVLALCCSEEEILSALSRCGIKLELLDIRFTPLSKLDLSDLPGIRQLNAYGNMNLQQIIGLESLMNLTSLDLSLSAYGSELNLCQMNALEELWIHGAPITKILLDHDLSKMRKFGANRSTIYNYDFLLHFPRLQSLDLLYASVTNLPQVANLTELQDLDLFASDIRTLPSLKNLRKLESLSLCCTPISLPDDFVFPLELQFLNLSDTFIHQLPDSIRTLSNLESLNLRNLKLDTLPEWLPNLGLSIGNSKSSDICLTDTTVEDIDDMSIFDQPQEVIRQWFEARKKAKEQPRDENEEAGKPLNEMKIVFLGDGGAGKTHTIARLLLEGENPDDFDGTATPGIVITDKDYTIGDRDIQVHYWDFGGQEILHSMHRMFLTNRTLYVVVLNVRDGTQDERARYWLHNIKSFAKDSPVLLVLNQMDQNANASINESDLRTMYPGLTEVVKMSAKTDTADYFRSNFMDVLKKRIGNFDSLGSSFLPSWSRLKERLHTMKEPYIRGSRYNELSEECGVINSEVTRKALLNWFNDLGVSFCYGGSAKLEDYVILRPDWITNAIYMILFNKMEEVHNGLVSHEAIHQLLRDSSDQIKRVLPGVVYQPEEVEYVLNVVRKFRLSFLVDADREFIPMLCDSNSMPVAAEYEMDPNTLEFRMEYEYLPNNVLHRLMVELRTELDTANVWLTGARFAQKSTGLSAVVKTEGNLLRIFVRAEKKWYTPDYYLDQIKDALERINKIMGLEVKVCHVAYKADKKIELFDYEALRLNLEVGQTQILSLTRRKMIPILDILRQTDYSVDTEKNLLLQRIIGTCEKLQDNRDYWESHEDNRTTYIRDMLREHYVVHDQTRGGSSELGENAGELDLDIRREGNIPWTIFEALNLSGKGGSQVDYWNRHLKKLLDNYNTHGLPFLFHVSYVTCAKQNFSSLCSTYFEHMRFHSPAEFSLQDYQSLKTSREGYEANHFLQAAQCVYDCGGFPTTVYHIFVHIGA